MSEALLKVENISVSYRGIKALDGVSFAVMPNEVFVLMGANGAGKTSMLRCISGLVPAQSGLISFQGASLLGLKPHDVAYVGVAHVPEGRRIFAHQNVQDNLMVSFIARGSETRKQALDRVYELFPRLKERAKQLVGTMSGGEQQMVAIGRAMMNQPMLMMLDEPSLGLSPLLTEQVFEQLDVVSKNGTSLLLVEQNAIALDLATRGIVLANGREMLQGDAAGLNASDFVRKAYLGI